MKYCDGQVSQLGDVVSLGGVPGRVVSDIDGARYGVAPEHSAGQWAYLGVGVMIEFERYGLIHYTEPEHDLVLVNRADGDQGQETSDPRSMGG
ncbi:hypothetical protein KPL74_00375 [Bacillus sp. NP157]|nr:hypothetical protein KPL74_00375 [Bacillus sp. NP157]